MTVLLYALVACENVGVHATIIISGCSRTAMNADLLIFFLPPSLFLPILFRLYEVSLKHLEYSSSNSPRHSTSEAPHFLPPGASVHLVLIIARAVHARFEAANGCTGSFNIDRLDPFQTALTRGCLIQVPCRSGPGTEGRASSAFPQAAMGSWTKLTLDLWRMLTVRDRIVISLQIHVHNVSQVRNAVAHVVSSNWEKD